MISDTNKEKRDTIEHLLRKDNIVPSGEKIDERILNKLVELCNLHSLPPEVLVNKINAVMLTENIKRLAEAIPRLEHQLQSSAAAASSAMASTTVNRRSLMNKRLPQINRDGVSRIKSSRVKSGINTNKRVATGAAVVERQRETPIQTPQKVSSTAATVDYGKEYSERTNSGEVVLHFNKELGTMMGSFDNSQASRSDLAAVEQMTGIADSTKFLYMYDKLQQRSDYVSNRLVALGEELLERNDLGYSQPVGTVVGSEAVYVGRILTESVNGDDRLNLNSILLEGFGDENTQKSKIVKLKLDHTIKHSFFPGQVVAIKGTMKDEELVVNEVVSDTGTPVDYDPHLITRSTSILVASGPFTTDDNVLFQPLKDLMERVKDEKPDVLLLIGPFVPKCNLVISSGDVEESFDDIFERCITDVLASLPIDTRLILVPSLEDVHHDYVYPQPAFDTKQQLDISDSRVQSLPNPSIFRVNGVTLGVNAFDIVSRLVATSYAARAYKGIQAREIQSVEHCVSQRSFYPLSIPTEHMPLDFSHAHHMEFSSAPSIMILPSNLPFVVEQVNGVLFINPQSLFIDGAAGLYATINVSAPPLHVKVEDEGAGDRMDTSSDNDGLKPSVEGIARHTSVKLTRI